MNRVKSYLFKYFILLFIIVVLFLSIYANYSNKEITSLAYVVALGIDKGKNNNLMITVQFSSNVNEEQNKSSSSGSSQSSSSSIVSCECETLDSGINLLNSYVSRNINFSHCKMIVISEELAKEDVSDYLLFLCNDPEVSSHANFMISKCDAKIFLENSNPILEGVSARYYEIAPFSYKYTGLTKATSLVEFFSDYLDSVREPTAILGNINNKNTHNDSFKSDFLNEDNLYVAGQSPITSENHVECMGLAVFKNGKFIGELNGLETICHLIITNKLKNCSLQINSPNQPNVILDVRIESSKSKSKVFIINKTPYIKIDINVNARISSIDRNISYTEDNDIKQLEQSISSSLQEQLYNYLYKITKTYKTDIDGFGKYATSSFITLQEWEKYNWLNNYEKSFFNVSVKTNLRSGYKFLNK